MALTEAQQEWVDALRSGNYEQGRGTLLKKKADQDLYCCLGVACNLFDKDGWHIEETATGETETIAEFLAGPDKLGQLGALTKSVAEWLGISSREGGFEVTDDWLDELNSNLQAKIKGEWDANEQVLYLTTLNDSGNFTFEDIAAIIESEPPELFGKFTD